MASFPTLLFFIYLLYIIYSVFVLVFGMHFIRIVIISLFVLSPCFANEEEAFNTEYKNRLITLMKLNQKVGSLPQDQIPSYLGSDRIKAKNLTYFQTFKSILENSNRSLLDLYSELSKLSIKNRDEIGESVFLPYCQNIYLVKALHDLRVICPPHSPFGSDVEEVLHCLSIFEDHFSKKEDFFSSLLKIEPIGKDKDDKLQRYAVNFNFHTWRFECRQIARSISTLLSKTNLDKLELPLPYKQKLNEKFEEIRRFIEGNNNKYMAKALISKKTNKALSSDPIIEEEQDLFEETEKEVAHQADTENFYFTLVVNEKKIVPVDLAELEGPLFLDAHFLLSQDYEKYFQIVLNPLNQIFEEEIFLSSEEKEKNSLLLKKLLEEKQAPKTPSIPQKKSVPHKKSKGKENHPPHLKNPKVKDSSQPLKNITNQDLSENEDMKREIPQITSQEKIEPVIVHPAIEEEPIDQKALAEKWLGDIIKETQGKEGGYFPIYQKAYSLSLQLKKNPAYFEAIEEAVSSLASRLNKIKESTSVSATKHFVPKNLEGEFNYFMNTPFCYLKDLRFGFVKTLFEGLKIKIDMTGAGSRIHFSFKDMKNSIHLTEKNNGILDSGRISSLRKWILDSGFTVKD